MKVMILENSSTAFPQNSKDRPVGFGAARGIRIDLSMLTTVTRNGTRDSESHQNRSAQIQLSDSDALRTMNKNSREFAGPIHKSRYGTAR